MTCAQVIPPGRPAPSPMATPVPEPASLAFLIVAVFAFWGRR